MKLKIRYFGRFAVEIGKFAEEIDVPENITIKELLKLLKEKYPFLKNETVEFSINGKYADENSIVNGEVSIFPPISGG